MDIIGKYLFALSVIRAISMRVVNAITVTIVGIVVAVGSTVLPITFPALTIGAGAIVAASILLFGRRSGKKHYAGAGAAYTLGLAGVIVVTGVFPSDFSESPLVALVSLGSVSAGIVVVTEGLALIVRRFGGEYAERVFKAIAAFLGLLGIIWATITAYEKAIRYAGVGVGGSAGFVMNLLGIELPIPLVLIDGSIDAGIVLFVGGVLIGFHTLDTIHNGWRATKATAVKSADIGKASASAAKSQMTEGSDEN